MSIDYFYEINNYTYIKPVDTVIPSVENKKLPQQDLSKYDSDVDDCICNKRKGKYLKKLNTSLINHKIKIYKKKNGSNKKISSFDLCKQQIGTKKKKKNFAKKKSRNVRHKAFGACLFDDEFYYDDILCQLSEDDIQDLDSYSFVSDDCYDDNYDDDDWYSNDDYQYRSYHDDENYDNYFSDEEEIDPHEFILEQIRAYKEELRYEAIREARSLRKNRSS
jgi:hypothetical protein